MFLYKWFDKIIYIPISLGSNRLDQFKDKKIWEKTIGQSAYYSFYQKYLKKVCICNV